MLAAMLADLLALLDKPLLLLIVLAIGGVIGVALESSLNRIDREKRRAYWRGRNSVKPRPGKVAPINGREAPAAGAAADQLKAVMKATSGRARCSTSRRRKCSRRSTVS